MLYLESFTYPSKDNEFDFFLSIQRKCYSSFYPFQVLSYFDQVHINFEPITIFYGGNGSGKTTALNAIAEKLSLKRVSVFNQSNFFEDYLALCQYRLEEQIPSSSEIITSDDVFDYALNIRSLNLGIDEKREAVFGDYLDAKYAKFQMQSLEDYERLKEITQARSKTQSKYVRDTMISNIRTQSNGENAFKYFTEKITENALFLLDEPENSLSPEMQIKLKLFIEEAVRFYNCQIIMVTHSPFLLSLEGAKIYDFDSDPIAVKHWMELKNIRLYHDFFSKFSL